MNSNENLPTGDTAQAAAGGSRALSVDALLDHARSRFERVRVEDLDREVAAGALLVDIRPVEQRRRDGELPGALVIDRNVLEWRLAPSSDARRLDIPEGRKVIIVCNQGYQSSLAAANLIDLGVRGATDLAGGFEAYLAARADAPSTPSKPAAQPDRMRDA